MSSTAATRFPAEDFHKPPTGATTSLTGTVKDKDTGAPVAGALVYVGGHSSGYAGDYAASTDADGKYTITGVAPGTYPKVVVSAPGYELLVQPVDGQAPAAPGELRHRAATGPPPPVADRSPASTVRTSATSVAVRACAIDNGQGTGWGSTTGDDDGTPTGTMIPKHVDIKLPAKVNVSSFNVDPSTPVVTRARRRPGSTGSRPRPTAPPGRPLRRAVHRCQPGKYNLLTPSGNATGVQYVRFWMLSPQVPDFATTCPGSTTGGCSFTDMTEVQVFGTK